MKRVKICRTRNNFVNLLKNFISDNKKNYIIFLAIAALGLLFAFFFPPNEEINYFYIKYYRLLKDPETLYYNFAIERIFIFTVILIIDYFCILNRYFVIVNGMLLFTACFHTMSSIILIAQEFGITGIFTSVLIIIPFGILILALLLTASVLSFSNALICYNKTYIKNNSKPLIIQYIIILVIACILFTVEASLFKLFVG